MDDTLFQALIRFYDQSASLVLIMDLHWNILWSNRRCEIDQLPKLLEISPNHIKNTVHRFLMNGKPHECRLLCNLENQCRIAEITPCEELEHIQLPVDLDTLTNSVHSITMACSALKATLDELDLSSESRALNVIVGNCYRIYRTVFLQKEIDRLQNGFRREEHFFIAHALRTAIQRMQRILLRKVKIELECDDESLFLSGDMDEFITAVLSAAVLCCHGSEYFQRLCISLEQRDGMVMVKLISEEEQAELEANKTQIIIPPDPDFAGEKALLNLFCQAHEGNWMFSESIKNRTKTCILQFPPEKTPSTNLTLHSSSERRESDFFNKYRMMLSCIQYTDLY